MSAGALLGLLAGVGLLAIWWSMWETDGAESSSNRATRLLDGVRDDLVRVGLETVPPVAVPLACGGTALVVGAAFATISSAAVPSLALGAAAGVVPFAVLRAAARRRSTALRDVWPEAVDHVASAVRAGMSLPEALSQLGSRGPEALRPQFLDFERDYQASGDFATSLDRLKTRLADPVGDRIVEALRITREVGGTELGVLLRTLSAFLREDARTRSELAARQSWTINAARMALIAPWAVLALMSTRPQAAEAYDTPTGFVVIAVGGVVSVIAYRVMLLIARLPEDERVLR